jgi:two-component system chemotaxis sensor kinase CheA
MEALSMDPEELKVFLQEAEEQLQLLDEDIVRLEKEADNRDLLQRIFRAAHTLKGSSAMLGIQAMAELTHAMEDALDKLRSGTAAVSPDLVDALLESLDTLKLMKQDLASGRERELDIAPLVAALQRAVTPASSAVASKQEVASVDATLTADPATMGRLQAAWAAGLHVYLVRITIAEECAWAAVRCLQVVHELSGLGEMVRSSPSQEEIEREQVGQELQVLLATEADIEAVRAAAASIDDLQSVEVEPWSSTDGPPDQRGDGHGAPRDAADRAVVDLNPGARERRRQDQSETAAPQVETLQTVRIDVERLDALMNMVGELVIDRTRVDQISRALRSRHRDDELVEALRETCTHIGKVVDELNEGMMQVRMLPIGTLFNKFPRLVRDLARDMGKSVDFILEGTDTEIDRSVIEKIKDPLVHLLRNAVDHGIEPPEVRQAAGKPLPARIRLSAHHEQGHIVIMLEDDGKGIDPRAVVASAVQRGIITAETAGRLSDAEAIDLIFEPGMSTASKTTEVSGRGVGMDVVKRCVSAVNGLIKIDTEVGKGTTFTLRLPLTLATFRALLVESGGAVYAIPLSYVQETGRLDATAVRKIIDLEVVDLRGTILPLLRLSALCQTRSGNGHAQQEAFMVVVKAGERPIAIAVHALRELQEIVVKSLGGYVGQAKGIAGASILGDGQVVLILDVAGLVTSAMQKAAALQDEKGAAYERC